MPTPMQIQSANSIAREFTVCAVGGRRFDAQEVVNDGVRWLAKALDAGADPAFVCDTARGLLDFASNADAQNERDLDAAGTWTPEKVDVSEVHALLAKVS